MTHLSGYSVNDDGAHMIGAALDGIFTVYDNALIELSAKMEATLKANWMELNRENWFLFVSSSSILLRFVFILHSVVYKKGDIYSAEWVDLICYHNRTDKVIKS